jgi:hypothetical protein
MDCNGGTIFMSADSSPITLEIFQLNHASVLLVMDKVRLLTDPWYDGAVFDDGWALRWQNPDAYKTAGTATHLWISHPHPDHLHMPTLQKIADINPTITILINRAYNYNFYVALRNLGFNYFMVVDENTPLPLSPDISVERIGAGAIDSALVIRWKQFQIVNLNDCVFQENALRNLARRLGGIDLLLCNFNHAGKLIHYPTKEPAVIQEALKAHFCEQVATLSPRYVLPFASFHYYLSEFSDSQNDSLLEPADLEGLIAGVRQITLYPSQNASLDLENAGALASISGAMPPTNPRNATPTSTGDMAKAISAFNLRMRKSFGPLRPLLPSCVIRMSDTGECLRLRGGLMRYCKNSIAADIEATSDKVFNWLYSKFGSEQFVIGVHFRILTPCIGRLKLLIALLILAEAKLSPRYLLRPSLWKFLFLRKDQVLAYLLSWRVSSSYQ